MLETFQPLRSVREHFHTWTCPDHLLNCACPAHPPSCFDGDALKHKCPQFMTKPLFSLCRWQLLGVWRRAADPGAGVHQDFGSVGIGDPGGPTLGPRLHLRHLLLQVRQLLEVQPPPKPCGVCLPEEHAGLEWHSQRCGRLFQGHLWYEATLVYWNLANRHMACAGAPHNKRHLFCSSFRLRPLYPRTTVLEIRPGGHELAGGLPSLCRCGFFWL